MDFDTDPEFQDELDWVDAFVREEVEPLDLVLNHAWDMRDPLRDGADPARCRRRCASGACGRATSGPSSAGRATGR